MFRSLFKTKPPLRQKRVIENYNKMAMAFKEKGFRLKQLNKTGVCNGLAINYLFFAQEGGPADEFSKRDEFYYYLEYIGSLSEENIQQLAEKYYQDKRQGKKSYVLYTENFNNKYINLDRMLDFLKVVSDSHKEQHRNFKLIGANWDRTYLIFCETKNLKDELKKARLTEERLIHVSIGLHAFAIEKVKNGFYVFEPNRIERKNLLKTEADVAKIIIENSSSFLSNANITLSLQFISYGDENREIDDFILEFKSLRDKEGLTEFAKEETLMCEYHRGILSRAEFALMLHHYLCNHQDLSQDMINFNKKLNDHLHNKNILSDQAEFDLRLQDQNFLHNTAYHFKMTTLLHAVQMNQIMLVQKLLARGANPAIVDRTGTFALYLAAQDGYTACVQTLLEHNANPNQTDETGYSSLLITAQNGHTTCVKVLLVHGANPDLADLEKGRTALYLAALNGHTTCVQVLLAQGANPDLTNEEGCTPLFMAAQNGHTECVQALLAQGANPDLTDEEGCTPLLIASENGHTECVQALLLHGANPDLADEEGCTPLYMAAQNGHTECVQVLLAHHANTDLTDEEGCTSLFMAAQNGHTECVQALLVHGTNPDLADEEGCTPLFMAAQNGHTECVQALLVHGANPDLTDEEGCTPLYMAAQDGHTECVQILLKHGASHHLGVQEGDTPLYIAAQNGHIASLYTLLLHGAKWDIAINASVTTLLTHAKKIGRLANVESLLQRFDPTLNKTKILPGFSPLHAAAYFGYPEIVSLLLDKGAEPDSKVGISALDFALAMGHERIVEILEAKNKLTMAFKASHNW